MIEITGSESTIICEIWKSLFIKH